MTPLRDSLGRPVFALKRGQPKARAKRDDPEHRLQCAVVKYLTWALPADVLWTSTLNGAHLGASQRRKMKDAGLRPGIADLVLVIRGNVHMIELKAGAGRLTPDQMQWQAGLGWYWRTCRSVEDVEAALSRWGVTPRVSIEKANRYG